MKVPGGIIAVVLCFGLVAGVLDARATVNATSFISTDASRYSDLTSIVKSAATPPKLTQPKWLKQQLEAQKALAAQQQAQSTQTANVTVTYTVQTRGTINSSLSEFKALVHQTLSDSRGWAGLGINFSEVKSGGSFNLILAQAEEVGKASSGCSSEWSCRVGASVYINDDRWSDATTAWNKAGGSLRDYRHMVVNHEVGHWLGHGHRGCSGPGKTAPLMQQQSIDLQGCKFNAWPLAHERYAPNLGIQ